MIATLHRRSVTAFMVALFLALSGTHVFALSLGKLSVLSALGEPLRAEIDISRIDAEEAASLKIKVAQPDAFKAAGLEYNAAMASLQVTLKKRHNGQLYLQLQSDRAIDDPFVDMIIEVDWNSGRIVRDYTMLFDPPSLQASARPAPQPAQSQAQTLPALRDPTGQTGQNGQSERPLPPARPTATAPSDTGEASAVTVRDGDTAGRIALAHKTSSVSLDQMLVALLRTNPDAFIGDNVHRIKAGAVLQLPTEDQVQATKPEQASQIIVAQSQDFNDFRRKLAASVPAAQVHPADRNISGRVQTKVAEPKTAALPDKLTLSKGSVSGKPADGQLGQMDRLAATRSTQDAASRAAEISKNLRDLGELAKASSSIGVAASGTKPSVAAPLSLPVVPSSAPASSASTASNAVSAASQSASAPAPDTDAASGTSAMSNLLDALAENPILPLAALGVVVLLAGLVFYEIRLRKKPAAAADSSFFESRMHPESFFGGSGGQNIDTSEHSATGSSMVYSPSQMDAVDDVDPVAEADVYLAYGRDMQAEEILKDALRKHPERISVHQKLLEIYHKRKDPKAFESVATLAYNLTDGKGDQWAAICVSGQEIDHGNALYSSSRQPESPEVSTEPEPTFQPDIPTSFGTEDENPSLDANVPHDEAPDSQPHTAVNVDLDLDFSLDEPITTPADLDLDSEHAGVPSSPMPLPELDRTPVTPSAPPASTASTASTAPAPSALPDTFDFELPDIAVTPPASKPDASVVSEALAHSLDSALSARPGKVAPSSPASSGMLEFDLGSLSLDMDDAPVTAPGDLAGPDAPVTPEDPLATKLALAEEFQAIGDDDGARALLEEVIAEASGDVKAKAQRALARLK